MGVMGVIVVVKGTGSSVIGIRCASTVQWLQRAGETGEMGAAARRGGAGGIRLQVVRAIAEGESFSGRCQLEWRDVDVSDKRFRRQTVAVKQQQQRQTRAGATANHSAHEPPPRPARGSSAVAAKAYRELPSR